MGYYIYLTDDHGHSEGEWNYTHNCNGMANAVLNPEYKQRSVAEEVFCFKDQEHVSWWRQLDGLNGPDGAALLHIIITGLESDPEQFRAMNPVNGWGNYDTFLAMLKEMRGSVPGWLCKWEAHG